MQTETWWLSGFSHLIYINSNTQHITWIIINWSSPENHKKAHRFPKAGYKELAICFVCVRACMCSSLTDLWSLSSSNQITWPLIQCRNSQNHIRVGSETPESVRLSCPAVLRCSTKRQIHIYYLYPGWSDCWVCFPSSTVSPTVFRAARCKKPSSGISM